MSMEFFATCTRGMEKVLGDELRQAGVHGVRPLSAGVTFHGTVEDAYTALMWSRVASRILLNVARIDAQNSDALYEGVKSIAWEDHIDPNSTIAIDARGTNERLKDTRFVALRAKDAVCDRMREVCGQRPNIDTHNPDVRINIGLRNQKATVSIDLGGGSIEHRGYESAGKPAGAPIRENLAAGMLLLAGWDRRAAAGQTLLNPYCGPGTLAIEAAMIAADVAPQLYRSSWGFERWLGHDELAWQRVLSRADERAEAGMQREHPRIVAWDADEKALHYARACAKSAGVASLIEFLDEQPCTEQLSCQGDAAQSGCGGLIACNLTGDGRFASLAQMPALYAQLATSVRTSNGVDSLAVLAADSYIDASLGLPLACSVDVRNGASDASVRVYDLNLTQNQDGTPVAEPVFVPAGDKKVNVSDLAVEQFVARLGKVYKQRRKWAKQNKVSAYRIYDADLPDYNMAIDLYCGAGPDEGKMLVHVAEYAAPKKIDPDKAARRMADALAVIPAVLGVDASDVYAKQRLRAKGGSQYARKPRESAYEGRKMITQENGLLFEVDLGDRLDTGLFLDHRDTRKLIYQLAAGKVFLNLFAYTGTASVYAAAGGAKYTTTVDMSNTYQDWTRRNFELNDLVDSHMELERADVLSWVRDQRHSKNRWDLIFVDPPTFSNSSKMGRRTWDVQADHAELLINVSRLLTRSGAIVFSCNLRDFKPDVEKLNKAGVVINEITDRTIPEDFARNKKIHHCYVLRRG